jgi:hypothetical protein
MPSEDRWFDVPGVRGTAEPRPSFRVAKPLGSRGVGKFGLRVWLMRSSMRGDGRLAPGYGQEALEEDVASAATGQGQTRRVADSAQRAIPTEKTRPAACLRLNACVVVSTSDGLQRRLPRCVAGLLQECTRPGIARDHERANTCRPKPIVAAPPSGASVLRGKRYAPLPDCFAIALAHRLGAAVVTCDHNEFDPIQAAGICAVRFFR